MQGAETGQWLRDGQALGAGVGLDRGLQFGDGLFETMAARDGRIPLLARHLDRLLPDCQRLGLKPPDRAWLEATLAAVIPPSGRAVVKLLVISADSGRGYERPAPAHTACYMAYFPWPEKQPETLSLQLCELRLSRQARLAGLKHCNRLEQVLARREVALAAQDEGLLLDDQGRVIEGVAANIFRVEQGIVQTPELSGAGVAGIMRALVIERARAMGYTVEVTNLTLDNILNADEVFMTNSLMGVCPVARLQADNHPYRWQTGPLTRDLQREIDTWR